MQRSATEPPSALLARCSDACRALRGPHVHCASPHAASFERSLGPSPWFSPLAGGGAAAAAPAAAGGGSGGGLASPKIVGSLVSAHSGAVEEYVYGDKAFLAAFHNSFPLACLLEYQGVLLGRGKTDDPPRSDPRVNWTFMVAQWASAFDTTRRMFASVVEAGSRLPPPPRNALTIKVSSAGSYTGVDFSTIEVDALVKIVVVDRVPLWTRDPSSAASIYHIVAGGHRDLEPATSTKPPVIDKQW
jgi:hypothetical protein